MTIKGFFTGLYHFLSACVRGVTETTLHAPVAPEATIVEQVAHDLGRVTGDILRIPTLHPDLAAVELIVNTSADVTRLIGDIGLMSSNYQTLADGE